MADQNLQTSGIADVLNSLGQGYLQGQQTLIARRAAAANLMRQQALINIQQQKADAQDTHNNLLSEHYGNQDTNGAQRVDYYGDHGLTEALQRYDMGAGGGKLPPDQYYQGVKNLVKTYGKDPAQYGVPPQYLDGYTPPANADGTPGTAPTVDPNALVGPTALSQNSHRSALDAKSVTDGYLKLQRDIMQGLPATQIQGDYDNFNQLNGTKLTPPMRPVNYGLQGPDLAAAQAAIADPNRHGPLKIGGRTLDVDALRSQPQQVIDNSPSGLNASRMALNAALGNRANVDATTLIPAKADLDKALGGYYNAQGAFIAGPKTALTTAQTGLANANTDYRKLETKMLPQMDQSIIDTRSGNLSVRQWEAQHGRPITQADVLRIEGALSKPGAPTMTMNPDGSMTTTPGKSAMETNPDLKAQLEALKAHVVSGKYKPSVSTGGKGGGVNPSAKAAARQLLGQ